MRKKLKIAIISILIIIFFIIAFLLFSNDNTELKTIKSDKELSKIYDSDDPTIKDLFINIVTMPFSLLVNSPYYCGYTNTKTINSAELSIDSITAGDSSAFSDNSEKTSSSKDYSTTNIQVENVDEADITKTDGDYIYSISNSNVIITNVINPENIKIEATIKSNDGSVPEDLILYKNELVVISTKNTSSTSYSSYYNYNNSSNTIVKIYNISTKSKPTLVKSYELYESYYTSRCINNKLYVIASGNLREENDKIVRAYKEDNNEQEISLKNIKYLKDVQTTKQTLISVVDLDDVKANINVSSYLIDISNAYVSENSIYLLDQKYDYTDSIPPISKLFGLKGILGVLTYNDDYDYSNDYYTEIYKFDISGDGKVSYNTKNKIIGKTINQYSLDEQNGHLRIALYDNDGAKIAIFDENLKQIGISNHVAKGEKMYSSRFMGNKAYLVTYKTVDPLFVIDLSNETKPTVLGELHIPGYSTYLHPYDENHLIGIGMETEEIVNKNSIGKVTSTTSKITGMKMALFDVSDVNNPTQLSQTIIGDSRTTSAILTNPKALLFSKEKQLLAIPVNNYSEDFEIDSSIDSYSSIVDSYTNYNKSYVSEGYFVYKININDGFNLKGVITHETSQKNKNQSSYSYNYYNSKLLRGLYIDNNLYTISETAIKVNNLDTLELIDELKIK